MSEQTVGGVMRTALLAVLWALSLCVLGCDKLGGDKAAVVRLIEDFKEANNASDGVAVSKLLTPESFTAYSRALFIAPTGKREDIMKLKPTEIIEVVRIRARATRKDIKGMDGLQYQIYATSQGWYNFDTGLEDSIKTVVVSPDGKTATATIFEDRRPTKYKLEFRKVGEKWLYHEPSGAAHADANYLELVRLQGGDMGDIALEVVSEEVGRELGDEIWKPMKP